MTSSTDLQVQLARVAGLVEGRRRTLYTYVAAQSAAVSRDEAAGAVGISRPLAAYHLDRLVDDGLLEARFERRSGRSGPGAGRPTKLYLRSRQPLELSVPVRDYAFIAKLLARAIESDPTGAAWTTSQRVAREIGVAETANTATGADSAVPDSRDVRRMLAERGYEPYDSGDGEIRLRNCPFERLTEEHSELVCAANLAFIEGVAEQLHLSQCLHPRLDPRPGECCVVITAG